MLKNFEKYAKAYFTPGMAIVAKKALANYRYHKQLSFCRKGFQSFGHRYPVKILFVAGLPKSGTTWLEQMLSCYDGFGEVMIPEAVYYELSNKGSHDYDLPADTFSRFRGNELIVLKLHVHGSLNNRKLLEFAKNPYVVIFRDLRDVAVSYFFYVRNTPWHPEYSLYKSFGDNVVNGLIKFSEELLDDYKDWILSWKEELSNPQMLMIRYEDLRANTFREFTKVAAHFQLDASENSVHEILDRTSFQRLSGGRKNGTEKGDSFFRKGIQGDWKNYFNEEVSMIYKKKIGQLLIDLDYEKDFNW